VTGTLGAGGAERVLSDMANYWARRGFEVTLATWCGRDVPDFYGLDAAVRREWLDAPLSKDTLAGQVAVNLRRCRKLRRLIRRTRPTALVSFIHTSNVLAILASLGLGVRIVVSERVQPELDPKMSRPWRIMRRLLYRLADEVVVQGRGAARWIATNCGRPAVVIPNPLRLLPPAGDARQPFILATGRLVPQKGFDLLLHAFARVAARFPEWRVFIAGDGPERERLAGLREELGLGGRVELLGIVRDIEAWMGRASLVVQPSRFEGFPNVVLESMGMGAAVISADCPAGPADLIADGVNGRLVPVEDVEALARAMGELMDDGALRASLGSEAVKVRERFHQERIMALWEGCMLPARGERAA
jgi:glycosyltransferase involved in cell wall biosynthesis